MTRRWFAVPAALIMAWLLNTVAMSGANVRVHHRDGRSPARVAQQHDTEEAARTAAFAPAHRLLEGRGLPFEPDALLGRQWRSDLGRHLAQVPEMSRLSRQSGPLHGVIMADTLQLSAATEVSNDTVLIVRTLRFDSRHPVIRLGPHAASLFVTESVEFASTGTERPSLYVDGRGWGRGDHPPLARGSSSAGRTSDDSGSRARQSGKEGRELAGQPGGGRETVSDPQRSSDYSGSMGMNGSPGRDGQDGTAGSDGFERVSPIMSSRRSWCEGRRRASGRPRRTRLPGRGWRCRRPGRRRVPGCLRHPWSGLRD